MIVVLNANRSNGTWNGVRTAVLVDYFHRGGERVSLIADILKNRGHCHFVYGEKYYVIIKYSQAQLMKNCHKHLDALKKTFLM